MEYIYKFFFFLPLLPSGEIVLNLLKRESKLLKTETDMKQASWKRFRSVTMYLCALIGDAATSLPLY